MSPGNMAAAQASSFLNGRLDLVGDFLDMSPYGDKNYSAFPPLPALLLVPLVAVLGTGTAVAPTLLSLALSFATAMILYRLFRFRMELDETDSFLLTIAFLLGTGYWMVASRPDGIWFLGHTVAAFFCIGLLYEMLGRCRPLLLGLLLGGAFASRQLTILYAPMVAHLIWVSAAPLRPTARLLRLAVFAVPLGSILGLQLWFNALRFSGPFDTGYQYMAITDEIPHGLFSYRYFIRNLIHTYFNGPHVAWDSAGQASWDPYGTSLVFASPFVLLAFRGRLHGALSWVAGWSVMTMAGIQLFYHFNGFAQVNCSRFTLDFLPIVMILVASGWKRCSPTLRQALVLYSVALNFLALSVAPRILGRLPG